MGRMSSEAIEALIPQLDAVDESPGAAALRARSYELLRAALARSWSTSAAAPGGPWPSWRIRACG